MLRAVSLVIVWTVLGSLSMPLDLSAQEEETQIDPTTSGVTSSEIGPFLGYWMLEMKFGERDVRMGLIIGRARDRSGGVETRVVSSFFGELEAASMRKDGDTFSFDLNAAFGQITVETVIAGKNKITGHLSDDQGRLSADFTGTLSDRSAFLRFTTPDNETRIQADDDRMIRLRFARPPAGERDYEQIASLQPGEVVQFLEHAVIKLTTEFTLDFGDLRVPTENIAENYPGVYGLWLKRTETGWSLAFNHRADSWGTQYDPEADLGEVPLTKGTSDEPSQRLVATMEKGETGATLQFTWGEHTWTTPFEIVSE